MKYKNIVNCIVLLAYIFFLQGCTKNIWIRSVELEPKATSDWGIQSRIALMPIVGHILSEKRVKVLKKAYQGYVKHTDSSEGIVNTDEVEQALLSEPELLSTYQKMVKELLDSNPLFRGIKGSERKRVDSSPWDGEKGLKYENIKTLCELDPVPKKIKLYWTINTKYDELALKAHLESSKALSEKLNCEYLLVPVVIDDYQKVKEIWTLFCVPYCYLGSFKYLHKEYDEMSVALYKQAFSSVFVGAVNFYLVHGQTGDVVRAISSQNIPLNIAASIQRILEKGDLMGTINFEMK